MFFPCFCLLKRFCVLCEFRVFHFPGKILRLAFTCSPAYRSTAGGLFILQTQNSRSMNKQKFHENFKICLPLEDLKALCDSDSILIFCKRHDMRCDPSHSTRSLCKSTLGTCRDTFSTLIFSYLKRSLWGAHDRWRDTKKCLELWLSQVTLLLRGGSDDDWMEWNGGGDKGARDDGKWEKC